MNGQRSYCLNCWGCGDMIQLPDRDDQQQCPNCGARLDLEWHPERPVTLATRIGPYVGLSSFTGAPLGGRSFTARRSAGSSDAVIGLTCGGHLA
jgi:DNA-directed RNA polymerase subunit RPC12/RpoP